MLGSVVGALVSAFVIGGIARWAVPGPDPMPFWLTVLIGLGGSLIGGGIAVALWGSSHLLDNGSHVFMTLLLEIGIAIALVILYRRLVQHRPISGPDARRFPTTGFGVQRLRERLSRLGVDPDRLGEPGAVAPVAPPPAADVSQMTHEQIVAERRRLRELHEKGELTEDELETLLDKLRRY